MGAVFGFEVIDWLFDGIIHIEKFTEGLDVSDVEMAGFWRGFEVDDDVIVIFAVFVDGILVGVGAALVVVVTNERESKIKNCEE